MATKAIYMYLHIITQKTPPYDNQWILIGRHKEASFIYPIGGNPPQELANQNANY